MVDIGEIKKRITCVEIAKRCGLPITKSGDRCRSPLHEGSSATSFVVFDRFWNSFSDAKGGDQIDLWAELKCGGDRGKAIYQLARMVGVEAKPDEKWITATQELIGKIVYFHKQLRQEDRDYLRGRGVTDETIARLRLGYDGTGIVIPYYKNEYVYDYTVRRYEGEPRYKRMGGAADRAPWGQHTLYRGDTLWLCEGSVDGILLDQMGLPVLITTNPEIDMIKRFKEVVLAYDNDETGEEYTRKVATKLFAARINFSIATIPSQHKDIGAAYAAGIRSFATTDGLRTLVASMTDIDDFRRFACQVARHCDRVRLVSLFGHATQFPEKEVRAVEKIASAPPAENDIASEIAEAHRIIYLDDIGFYIWDGFIWRRKSDMEIRQLALTQYGGFATAQRISAVCNLLKAMARMDAVFDRKPVLTFLNGTLELDTGRFRSADPADYCSIQMSYPYDPDAAAPKWEQFIHDIANEDEVRMENLQFIAGYVLFPDCRHQKMFALIGAGGNGKSVYIELLQKLFGDKNCSNVDPTGISEAFERIYLKDSLLNVGSEIDTDFSKAEKILKKVSAGEEVTACYKGMNFVKFYPRCKLLYACNDMPRAAVVKGLDRRLVFIDFPCRFVETPSPGDPLQKQRDLDIIPKLMTELSGIFNWAYKGYKNLMRYGYFTETEEQATYMQQFKEVSNPVLVFVGDFLWEEGQMTKNEIYARYQQWCSNTGHKALARETFFPKWKEAMGKRFKSENRIRVDGKLTLVCHFNCTGVRIDAPLHS